MKTKAVGVIIGRFQVADPHEGHFALLRHVAERHERVLVLLGVGQIAHTRRDPLDYATREFIFKCARAEFGAITVLPLHDRPSDHEWSLAVDAHIASCFGKTKAVLYGGRNSFIPRYHGRHKTSVFTSGYDSLTATIQRAQIASDGPSRTADFRRGAIYTTERSIPRLYMCVDVAVLDKPKDGRLRILLGRKHRKDLWCLPGGFVDPTDESLAHAAARELAEETKNSIDVGGADGMEFIGSCLVDDWRYKGPDRIMTALFCCWRSFGSAGFAKAGDDLAEVRWFHLDKNLAKSVKPHHQPLIKRLLDHANMCEGLGFK